MDSTEYYYDGGSYWYWASTGSSAVQTISIYPPSAVPTLTAPALPAPPPAAEPEPVTTTRRLRLR